MLRGPWRGSIRCRAREKYSRGSTDGRHTRRVTAGSVDEYLLTASPEAAALIAQVRAIIHELIPDAVESIAYGMPTFAAPGHHRFHLAAWAKHVGVYPVGPAPEPLESRLAPLRAAKDTVRLPLKQPLDDELARQLLAFLLARPSRS